MKEHKLINISKNTKLIFFNLKSIEFPLLIQMHGGIGIALEVPAESHYIPLQGHRMETQLCHCKLCEVRQRVIKPSTPWSCFGATAARGIQWKFNSDSIFSQ